MSSTTQNSGGSKDGAVNDVASTQWAGPGLSSPLSNSSSSLWTSSSDLLAGVLKNSAENSALHAKLTENMNKTIESLLIENARLRQGLAGLGNPMACPESSSVVVGNSPKFKRFPDLPIEIRHIIWELVAHHTRIVEVREVFRKEGDSQSGRKFKFMNHTPPAMLYVNQESRKQGLRHYELTTFNNWQYDAYFNTVSDVLYLGFCPSLEDDMEGSFAEFLGETVSRVAISSDTFHKLGHGDPHELYDVTTEEQDQVITLFAKHGITEILLVDETYTKNSADETDHLSPSNLNRDLNLTRSSLEDVLKDKVTGRPADYFAPLPSVSDFLEDTEAIIQEAFKVAKEEGNSDVKRELRGIDLYEPTVTMLKLRFVQPKNKENKKEEVEDELGFVYEGGKRQINWL